MEELNKFGGLVVYLSNRQIKIHQIISYSHIYVWRSRTDPPNLNMFRMAIWDPTTKFNSRQYFWLYTVFWMISDIIAQSTFF